MKTCALPPAFFQYWEQTNQSDDYLRQAEEVKAGINSNLFNGKFYLARTDTNGNVSARFGMGLAF